MRDEFLNVEVFLDMADLRWKLESWRADYNLRRPHSALGDRTPAEFALRAGGNGLAGRLRRNERQPGTSTGFPDGGPCGAVPRSPPAASSGAGVDPGARRKTPVIQEALSLAQLGLSMPLFAESSTAQSRNSSP